MVWSQAPIYHRDRLLVTPEPARRGAGRRSAAPSSPRARHASVITHSVANELSAIPDEVPGTAELPARARPRWTRDLDPTLPVSVDLLSYPGYGRQATYARNFDLLGINSYFGWYPGKPNRSTARLQDLGPYLRRMRALYPRQALMITEFGAESTFQGPATSRRPSRSRPTTCAARSTSSTRCPFIERRDLLDAARVRRQARLGRRGQARRAARRDPQQGPDHLHRQAEAGVVGRRAGLRARRRCTAAPATPPRSRPCA